VHALEVLGYCASAASGGAFLPQAIRALRSRQTRDLSLPSVGLGAAGTLLWAIYGAMLGSGPIIVSNLIVMPFALATLVMKILEKRVDRHAADIEHGSAFDA
jgi:MtN3 and saliva related transmembrane protein